ncbi:DUF937 domain-containing protein [Mycobacterium pseudokansasii]|uniref:DUF937 domain-containing protein n=1 Tax=Mycobacterium pseudokansasii TaxID=2341080 RepID=UPI0007B4FAC5|nr:DUF937 domain-containing protein [Mycobacterium pseudokansasii]KZS66516.1 hypothetical protein A4G27_05205 [Mycobacterium kansasii]VAZ98340.1 hypothetical protein LAUMK35_03979 [Mycobacterium pseudokansasii]VAZ99830.1 hypothetical protein LAUMK21_03975 [Mycobacterium pseudokansasii]
MPGLDDLYAQIPTSDIARTLGADETEVDATVRTLVPVLLTGLHQHSQDPEHAGRIESAASSHAARGLLDAGGALDQVDRRGGEEAVATLFAGNDSDCVASALASGGAGRRELLQRLLPLVLPIVLAYLGNQLRPGGALQSTAVQHEETGSGGGQAQLLGGILGGGNDETSLGNLLGGRGRALGDIIGGLLGGKK